MNNRENYQTQQITSWKDIKKLLPNRMYKGIRGKYDEDDVNLLYSPESKSRFSQVTNFAEYASEAISSKEERVSRLSELIGEKQIESNPRKAEALAKYYLDFYKIDSIGDKNAS